MLRFPKAFAVGDRVNSFSRKERRGSIYPPRIVLVFGTAQDVGEVTLLCQRDIPIVCGSLHPAKVSILRNHPLHRIAEDGEDIRVTKCVGGEVSQKKMARHESIAPNELPHEAGVAALCVIKISGAEMSPHQGDCRCAGRLRNVDEADSGRLTSAFRGRWWVMSLHS